MSIALYGAYTRIKWTEEEELALALKASTDMTLEEQTVWAVTIPLRIFPAVSSILELFACYLVKVVIVSTPL